MASLRLTLCLALLALTASALAQALRVDAPAGRLVAPGEFVTLVFRLDGPAGLELEGEATSASGWQIVRQPGTIVLDGGAEPIAVTVAVPSGAEAALTDTVTLLLRGDEGEAFGSTTLTVADVIELELQLPATVLLDDAGPSAVALNRGNVAVEAVLTLTRQGVELASIPLTLEPNIAQQVSLPVEEEGFYELRLDAGDRSVGRTVRALRFGVPPPTPLALRAEAGAAIDSGGRWNLHLTLEGALSDFVAVDARIDSDLERSFVTLSDDSRRQLLHLGGAPPRPFRLPLPTVPGLVVLSEREPWGSAFAGGWSPDTGAAAYAAFRYSEGGGAQASTVAAAAGWAEGAPLAVGRGSVSVPLEAFALDIDGGVAYRAARVDADLAFEGRRLADLARAALELQLRDALDERARFEVRARASDRLAGLYGDVVIALGPQAAGSWQVGGDLSLPTALPGQLRAQLQIGAPTSFAVARHTVDLAGGWQGQSSLGLLGDERGFGLKAATLWRFGSDPGNGAQLGFDLTYRPQSGAIDGRVDGLYRTEIDALALLVSASWDLSEQAIAVGSSVAWRDGDWSVQLDLDGGYLYGGAPDPWRFEVGLQGSYGFDFAPDPALTTIAGGRNHGRVEGRLTAGGMPIAGAEIAIDRFRLQSDADGRFDAELEPGPYRLRLDVASLPVDVRPAGPSEIEVAVILYESVEVAFALERTASLAGRVLVDSDRDGTPDDPAAGVAARLLVFEANGVIRTLETDGDGRFEARGVAPGAVELRLIELPFGSSVVGPNVRTFEAIPGERLDATFLSHPAAASAQTFGSGLRISEIDTTPRSAPPGAAPLVGVTVRGEVELVTVDGPLGAVELTRVGERWLGRYPLPDDVAIGPLPIRIVAEGSGERSERGATLLVDPDTPLFEAAARSPAAPGKRLTIVVDAYLEATSIVAAAPDAGSIELTEVAPGRWTGELAIPDELTDGVYDLTVAVVRADGRRFEQALRYRVLVEGDAP